VRGDTTERPLERPGEGRQYKTTTAETRYGETLQNSLWKDQVSGDTIERPLERPVMGRQYRMAHRKTR